MAFESLEDKRVFQRAEQIADRVWDLVAAWDWFTKKTVGAQLVRAADSIGANIAESAGRYHPGDVRNFLYYARGSLQETRFWLRRAERRGLLATDVLATLVTE